MRYSIVILVMLLSIACTSKNKVNLEKKNYPESNNIDVIICTDCGVEIDDQWMISHFIQSDRFNVLAIISSHCNQYEYLKPPQAESSMKEIERILEISGKKNIKTVIGNNKPLEKVINIFPPTADIIYGLAKDYSENKRLNIVVSGPATDISVTLVKYPDIAGKIQIVATAFQSKKKWPSFNVNNDILAWKIILESKVPVTVCPGPVAMKYMRITKDTLPSIINRVSAIGRYLTDIYTEWIESNELMASNITGEKGMWPIWDEILVSHLLGYTKTEETTRPKMLDGGDFDYALSNNQVKIEWIYESDSEKTWHDFSTTIP
jgi:inosine-uridine nucleoside N-ribohydrolase